MSDKEFDMQISLYDMNKQLMEKEPVLDAILVNRKCKEAAAAFTGTEYVMLLNKERSDYTIFHISERATESTIAKEIVETIQNRGRILSIDKAKNDNAFEIWIKDFDTEETFCYYLFDYTFGIVEVE